jgi:hypothetical protein
VSLLATINDAAYNLEHLDGYSICASIADITPAVTTFVSGVAEKDTFNFATKAGSGDGDYVVENDANGLSWAIALDTTGGAANTPTGAIWTAIPAARKAYLNISAAGTAASVATAVKAGFNALTGFTAVFTADDSAADGHLANTATTPGVCAAPSVHNKGDTGAGSVTVVVTITGTATKVNPTANTVTITAHGYATGVKITGITTSGTLPAGLVLLTAYYAIVVDANTLKFATSLANALAGTAVDITDYGVGTATMTATALAGTIKLQACNNAFLDNVNSNENPAAVWVDVPSSSTAVSGATSILWNVSDVFYEAVRIAWTATTGNSTLVYYMIAKGQG